MSRLPAQKNPFELLDPNSKCLKGYIHTVERLPDKDKNGTWVFCIYCGKYRFEGWIADRTSKGRGSVPHSGAKEPTFSYYISASERNALIEHVRRQEGLIPTWVLKQRQAARAQIINAK